MEGFSKEALEKILQIMREDRKAFHTSDVMLSPSDVADIDARMAEWIAQIEEIVE